MNRPTFGKIENVSYRYPLPQGKQEPNPLSLDTIDLQVEEGEYLALLGHNGSGKSTLARHFNGLLLPETGRVLINGLDTRDPQQRRQIRERIGMIFHNPDNQLISTVVEDDVAWSLAVRGYPREKILERVEKSLTAVGALDLRKRPPQQLSGGQRQRVAIAGILALQPRCIIADEATALLDPLSRREIVDLLHRLNQEQGLTIIQVTHLLDEAARAERIVVLDHGRIAFNGSPISLFEDSRRIRNLNLEVPEPIALASSLRKAGFPIASEALTIEEIAAEIREVLR